MIYVASILDGDFVKIGFTESNVAGRIADLQVGNPFQISLDFVVEGTLRQEKLIHAALRFAFEHLPIPCPP